MENNSRRRVFIVAAVIIVLLLFIYLLWPKAKTDVVSAKDNQRLVKLEEKIAAIPGVAPHPRAEPIRYAATYLQQKAKSTLPTPFPFSDSQYDSNMMYSFACIIVRNGYIIDEDIVPVVKSLLPDRVVGGNDFHSKWQNLFTHLVWHKFCVKNQATHGNTAREAKLIEEKSALVKALLVDMKAIHPIQAMLALPHIHQIRNMSSSIVSRDEDKILQKALYHISRSWFWVSEYCQFNPFGDTIPSMFLFKITKPLIHLADYIAGQGLERGEPHLPTFNLPLPSLTENEKEQFEMGIASYPFSQRMSIKRAMPPLVMPKKGKSSWHFLQTTTGDYRFIERTAGIVWQVSHAGGGVTFYCGGPVDRNFVSHGPRIDVASTLAHLELDKKLHLFAVLNNGALLLLALLNLAENYFDFVIEDDNIRAELVLYSTRVTKEIESEITAVKGAVLENGIENLHLFGPPLDMTILGAGKKVTVKPQPNYRSEVIRFERTGSEDKTHRNSSTVKFTKFSNVLTNAAAETTLELVVDEKKTFNVSYKDGVLAIKK